MVSHNAIDGQPNDVSTFTNARLILPTHAAPVMGSLSFSTSTGRITSITLSDDDSAPSRPMASSSADTATIPIHRTKTIDLQNQILAPGFLDLQTNGMAGVHFTTLVSRPTAPAASTGKSSNDSNGDDDINRLAKCARLLATSGTTAFWATIPTVPAERWREILPVLQPREFTDRNEAATTATAGTDVSSEATDKPIGAALLGAHVEGPYLAPSKRGAHAAEFMLTPSQSSFEQLYGTSNLVSSVKMITLAPELPGALDLIGSLGERYPHIRVSLGHSAASYDEAQAAVERGASMLTHLFNAMNGWSGRDPGLPGLMMGGSRLSTGASRPLSSTTESPKRGHVYYSIIADSIHLSPRTAQLALKLGLDGNGLGGGRCIAITDAIELAGLPDGVYEGNGQIQGRQIKTGNRVVKEDSPATLVGSCVLLDECVRVLVAVQGEAEEGQDEQRDRDKRLVVAVKCVSQNVADMMGEETRGRLEVGRRADFAVMSWDGRDSLGEGAATATAKEEKEKVVVRETWIGGWKVFERQTSRG